MGQRGKVCSLAFSIQKSVDDSNLYYFKDKGSIKITSKLEALGRALLSGAVGWILTKFAYFTSIWGPHVAPKENSLKKIYRSEFLQSSFIFVIYLLKEVYRKIMSEIYFVGKTRYEDLTETGSQLKFHVPSNLSRTVSYWEYVNESNSQVLLL